jgi:hypothetical protein
VNIGVVVVDEGMVALEIPVVERPHVVARIGDEAVQRGHRVQIRRTHAFSSYRDEPSPASPTCPTANRVPGVAEPLADRVADASGTRH